MVFYCLYTGNLLLVKVINKEYLKSKPNSEAYHITTTQFKATVS